MARANIQDANSIKRDSILMRSEEKKDPESNKEEGSGRKVPSGFEKLLKRSKRSTNAATPRDSASEEDSAKEDKTGKADKKAEKNEESAAQQDTDKDEDDEKSSENKQKKEKSSGSGWREQVNNAFFDPNSGGPKWENWLMAAIMGATGIYYATTM